MAMVQESFEQGKTVSTVARAHGVSPNQLFHWRKQYLDGHLSAARTREETIMAAKLADALRQIHDLQRKLSRKTTENEILREAVEYGRANQWIAHFPWLPGDEQ